MLNQPVACQGGIAGLVDWLPTKAELEAVRSVEREGREGERGGGGAIVGEIVGERGREREWERERKKGGGERVWRERE